MGLMDILQQYAGAGATDRADASGHFDQVAQQLRAAPHARVRTLGSAALTIALSHMSQRMQQR